MSTSIHLLKVASARETGQSMAKALKYIGRKSKDAVRMGADAGGGFAKEVGAPEALGRVAGGATVIGGAGVGATKAKREVDEYLYRRRMMRGGY